MIPRLIGSVLSLAVIGGGYYIIRSQQDTVAGIAEKATKIAAQQATGGTDKAPWQGGVFAGSLQKLKTKVGSDKQVLEFTVAQNLVSITVRDGKTQRAKGFRYRLTTDSLESVDVTISGDGDIKNSIFPLRVIKPGTPAKIFAALRRKTGDPNVDISAMVLRRPYTSFGSEDQPRWFISVTANGRSYSYKAKADGSSVKKS